MTGVIQQCGSPEPDDPCERIRGQIRKLVFQTKKECGIRGLRERIMDQIYGANGPGTPEWNGHDIAITNLKNQIKKLMDDFIDNNCTGGSPIGADAKAWLNRPNPKPEEWKGQASNPTSHSMVDWEYWEKLTGLTGAALVLYLIVSEGSRLFPPRNLVPVP
jgi:hypothetical protein